MLRIEDYAIIGDLHTAALVGVDGSIDWLCLPHFDSPACFAALLDNHDAEAGRWLLAPASGGRCTRRRYQPDTLVLQTEWETPEGNVRVTDFMPPRDDVADVIRIVEGLSGTVTMRGELALRFDYGQVVPWVRHTDHGIHAVAGPDSVLLSSPAEIRGKDKRSVSEFTVSAGDTVPFVLTWHPSHQTRHHSRRVDPAHALAATERFWRDWSASSRVAGPHRDAVQRSLITLKALTYEPTGGIVAAATTSLPEQWGGSRNWDYRYCWLRDAALTLEALLVAGYTDEATAWRRWLLRSVAGDPADLQIMYALDGRRRIPEAELDWLAGFAGSAPVRTGNGAATQFQLDVWGEALEGLALTRDALERTDDDSWGIQTALMEHLEKVWDQPDNGLWEMRGPQRHFTHSKVMAWVAADRMVKAVEEFGVPGPVDRWRALRETIHADVLAHGYDADRNTFVQSYGSTELDASLLLIPRVGFLPADDPRVVGTIEAIEEDLVQDGFVLRYRPEQSNDGLAGTEGVFLACSFWLVDALVGAGRHRQALELFERLLSLRNDVGLLSEEWDTVEKRHLGNTPQAFSHLALVNSAFGLQRAGLAGSEASDV